jgi:hypothetical protein
MTNEDAGDGLGVAVIEWKERLLLFLREDGRVDAGKAQALDGRWEILIEWLSEQYQYTSWIRWRDHQEPHEYVNQLTNVARYAIATRYFLGVRKICAKIRL